MLVEGRAGLELFGKLHELVRSDAGHRLLPVAYPLWREELLNDCGEELRIFLEEDRVAHHALEVLVRRQVAVVSQEVDVE